MCEIQGYWAAYEAKNRAAWQNEALTVVHTHVPCTHAHRPLANMYIRNKDVLKRERHTILHGGLPEKWKGVNTLTKIFSQLPIKNKDQYKVTHFAAQFALRLFSNGPNDVGHWQRATFFLFLQGTSIGLVRTNHALLSLVHKLVKSTVKRWTS